MLLYSLICAYLSASGDLLQTLLHHLHWMVPRWIATVFATFILGFVVFQGIRSVDVANRFLMSTKFVICLLLIGSVLPFIHLSALNAGNWHFDSDAWLVIITSFGYSTILPSIRDYLHNDKQKLMRVFIIGSIIPLILYFVWIAVIQGALPRFGAQGLVAMNNSANTNSLLMSQIGALTDIKVVRSISIVFISICSITGFLSVSTSLMDSLTDVFKREKHGSHRLWIAAIAFLPPMLIVILYPEIFIRALAYAGACCLYVLVALPIAMFMKQKRMIINKN
jgi:tyrosine-specific transport protein